MTNPSNKALKDGGQQAPAERPKPIEVHAAALETPMWLFAAAKAAQGWGAGQEITATEYRKAIGNAEKEKVG